MTCAGCVTRIENHLLRMPGVADVRVSLLTCKGKVRYVPGPDTATPAEIGEAIAQIGFTVEVDTPDTACTVVIDLVQQQHKRSLSDKAAFTAARTVLEGMDSLPGVEAVKVWGRSKTAEGAAATATISYNPAATGARLVLAQAAAATNRAASADEAFALVMAFAVRWHGSDAASGSSARTAIDSEVRKARRALIIALALCVPIVFLAVIVPAIESWRTAMDTPFVGLLGYRVALLGLLTSPIQLYIGAPLYRMAFNSLYYSHRANMDVLVMLSTTTAYVYSLVSVILMIVADAPAHGVSAAEHLEGKAQYHTLFETSAFLLTLIIAGRLMAEHAKGRTSTVLSKLMDMQVGDVRAHTSLAQSNTDPPSAHRRRSRTCSLWRLWLLLAQRAQRWTWYTAAVTPPRPPLPASTAPSPAILLPVPLSALVAQAPVLALGLPWVRMHTRQACSTTASPCRSWCPCCSEATL